MENERGMSLLGYEGEEIWEEEEWRSAVKPSQNPQTPR